MITQETAAHIWKCYREITVAEKLLADMQQSIEDAKHDDETKYAGSLRDAFGLRRDLQLGVPSGENGHRLFDVSPKLAESVILAHIANKRAELVEANEQAKLELGHAGGV